MPRGKKPLDAKQLNGSEDSVRRDVLERDHTEVKVELDDTYRQIEGVFNSYSENNPATLVSATCKFVLGIEPRPDSDEFALSQVISHFEQNTRVAEIYGDIATAILARRRNWDPNESQTKDELMDDGVYVSLRELHIQDFYVKYRHNFKGVEGYQRVRSTTWLFGYLSEFFARFEEEFAASVVSVHAYVYQGVPLFRKNSLGQWEALSRHDPIVSAMSLLGKHCAYMSSHMLPKWFTGLHMRREHLRIRARLWDGYDPVPESEHEEVQDQLRKLLGLAPEALKTDQLESRQRGTSRLLRIALELVNSGAHAAQFEATGVWPLQKQLIHELREKYGLSENQAKAIDIVVRPDSAR